MDSITKAVQRARELRQSPSSPFVTLSGKRMGVSSVTREPDNLSPSTTSGTQGAHRAETSVQLDATLLQRNRIVAFEPTAFACRHYDLLRDQIIHDQMGSDCIIVAVAGAAAGSGATVTAANLAFTFARNQKHRVVLISPDGATDPSLLRYLGLEGQDWQDASWPSNEASGGHILAGNIGMWLEIANDDARDNAHALIDGARTNRRWPATVIVLDLPPLPASDLAAAYISLSTNVVVVLASGETTLPQVESCKSILGQRSGVHYILNKTGRHGL